MAVLKPGSTTGRKEILNETNFTFNLSNYATIDDAVTAIGGEEATLYIPRGQWDADNVVFTKNLHLIFDKGALLTGDFELNSSFEAGAWQIFHSSSTVTRTNPERIDPVYPEWFGAKGDGLSDDDGLYIRKSTDFIQNTKNSKVVFSGVYRVRADQAGERIEPHSYCTLEFLPNSAVHVVPNAAIRYHALFINGTTHDVCINGAHIIGDRTEHDYSTTPGTHEWGGGIRIESQTGNVVVKNCTVEDCTGDGIAFYCPTSSENKNTLLKDSVFKNNRRQGCSIISWVGLTCCNCVFSETNGTAPQAGVDIEPNMVSEPVDEIHFHNCRFEENAGCGLQVHMTSERSGETFLEIDSCLFRKNQIYSMSFNHYGSTVGSTTIVKNCISMDNAGAFKLHEPTANVTYFVDLYEKDIDEDAFTHITRLE